MLCLRGLCHDFLPMFFLSHSTEELRWERIRNVFHKTCGSESFMDERGGCQGFLSKLLCLTVPKSFVEEPFSVSLNWSIEKLFG